VESQLKDRGPYSVEQCVVIPPEFI
jgi:hypothetical protein